MITAITLKYFRKHEDLSINLTDGLNVLRGPNEIGKTTVTEGVLYALYGANALRNPVADTVTWGHKENDLSASVVIVISGVTYTFTRSPKGAECNYAGGKVTGQKEVTKFAGDLLGADAKTASVLMMSSQSDLRGTLSKGATEVSLLMSRLAQADYIDKLLLAAERKLLLGSADPVKAKLAAAEQDVATALAAVPDPAHIQALRDLHAMGTFALEASEGTMASAQTMMLDAERALADANQANSSRRAAQDALASLQTRLQAERGRLDTALAEAARKPDPARIVTLRAELADVGAARARLATYNLFLATPAYPEIAWDTDQASFEAEVKVVGARWSKLSLDLGAAQQAIKSAELQRITNGRCPTCGSVKVDDAHVAARNAEVDAQVKALVLKRDAVQVQFNDTKSELDTLAGVDAYGKKIAAHLAKLGDAVVIDASTYPVKASWKGEVPVAVDPGTRAAELAQLEKAERDAAQAEGRVTAHRAAIAGLEVDVVTAEDVLSRLPLIETQPLIDRSALAFQTYTAASNHVRTNRDKLNEVKLALNAAERDLVESASRIDAARARVAEHTSDLAKLTFNNALVKKLKTLKPAITDFLWNTVLSAVSNFFSTIRGEQSIVSKDGDGFSINGKPSDSFSGSTLDSLALAIRIALSKTFVPHASFLVLDEPAHGCDTARTGNMLGFLASVGFQQTILASHDELSESVANNVVLLGE